MIRQHESVASLNFWLFPESFGTPLVVLHSAFLNWNWCKFRIKNFVKLPFILGSFFKKNMSSIVCAANWSSAWIWNYCQFHEFFFGINKISGNCHIPIALFFEFYSTNVCCHGSTFFFRLDWNHFGVHLVDHRWSYIGSYRYVY